MLIIIAVMVVLALLVTWLSALAGHTPQSLGQGLEEADVAYYPGDGPAGGLAHIRD